MMISSVWYYTLSRRLNSSSPEIYQRLGRHVYRPVAGSQSRSVASSGFLLDHELTLRAVQADPIRRFARSGR
jgi:hypothetical protein